MRIIAGRNNLNQARNQPLHQQFTKSEVSMKFLKYALMLSLSLSFQQVAAEVNPSTDKEKLSYSMGVFFGQTVTRQNLDVDVPAFMQAVEDVLSEAELKMNMQEMQQVLSAYQQKEQDAMMAEANQNKVDGKKFLAENKKKDGVIELESGLQYKVIKKGEGDKPAAEDTVIVHYRGTLLDGTEFDSSYSRGEPAEINIARVIQGWQEALQLMPVGSNWQLAIPSDLAYGERGAGGGAIGPNSTLLFEVELIAIK
jgi:FKBP-type peptidyl-prolyl cis-trans isomerase FklB